MRHGVLTLGAMPRRLPANSRIKWVKPEYGPLWATIDGVEVGCVNQTAIEGRWASTVKHTSDWRRDMHCYVASVEQGKYFIERYYANRHPDPEALRQGRRAMLRASDPPLPRKPKGLEDRS